MWSNLAENRHKQAYINPSGKRLDGIHLFSNPMMRSAIIRYSLEESSFIKIAIYSVSSKAKVKDLLFIPGNPGGRRGENKVFWDGSNDRGTKVPYGQYLCKFSVENQPTDKTLSITF